jgi:hypothetical protein
MQRDALRMARMAVALDDRDCMNQCVLCRGSVRAGGVRRGDRRPAPLHLAQPQLRTGIFRARARVGVGRPGEGSDRVAGTGEAA